MKKKDRRIFERFDVDFSAKLKQAEIRKQSPANCFDVSATGIGVLTEEKLIPTPKLEVSVDIPDGYTPLRSGVRLIWTRKVREDKWRSGLEFKGISLMALRRVLDKQIKK
ncbi:PilZ domain-containing protein [Candidatus Omnitrophota bacterium]